MTDRAAAGGRPTQYLFDRAAEQGMLVLGRRLKVGSLTLETPDGRARTFRGTQHGPHGDIQSTTSVRSGGSCSEASRAPVRRTWTGCGAAMTYRPH